MTEIGIEYLDYYIPEKELTITSLVEGVSQEQIPEFFNNKEEYLEYVNSMLGYESIRIEQEFCDVDLFTLLLDKMFKDQRVNPLAIDILVLCDESRFNQTRNIGQLLMYKFGIENAYTLTWSGNQCCNLEVAIQNLANMMKGSDMLNKVLILSNISTGLNENRIVDTYGIRGDATGLILLSKNAPLVYRGSCLITENVFYDSTVNKDMASLQQNILGSIQGLFDGIGESAENVSQVIIQNANPLLMMKCLQTVGIDDNKIYKKNLSKYGHLDCIDFIVNLKDYLQESYKRLDKILTIGMGFSGTFISSLYEME